MVMERHKPVEVARDTLRIASNAGRYALHQMGGGAWGELGERYGEAMGGHEPHTASIQLYNTTEQLRLDIPDNIVLGAE